MLIGLGLVLSGCDLREGTIVYDVDFPQADSCESTSSCDSGAVTQVVALVERALMEDQLPGMQSHLENSKLN